MIVPGFRVSVSAGLADAAGEELNVEGDAAEGCARATKGPDATSVAIVIEMAAIGVIRIAPNLRAVASEMRSEKWSPLVYPQIRRFYPQKGASRTSHSTRKYL
jgi:hypothetical protein